MKSERRANSLALGRPVFSLLVFLIPALGAFAQTAGSMDAAFTTGSGSNNIIQKIAIQPDGKIIVAGTFTTYNGTASNQIARLNTDGTLDNSFSTGTGVNKAIQSIALQPDGKILIGGKFGTYNGTTRDHLARLTSTGALDGTFSPGSGFSNSPEVRAIVLQPDGKIMYGGQFSKFNGSSSEGIVRLNTDGSLDNTFVVAAGTFLYSLAIQPDGKFLIGQGGGTNIKRVSATGAADATFTPGTGANNTVDVIVLQPDGKILIGGFFDTYNGTTRNHIARLNSDGTLDASFNPGTGTVGTIISMALQSDGKILIGGTFLSYNGTTRNRIARLNSDGSLDTGFNPGSGANGDVNAIALTSTDDAVLGGGFTTYNGTSSSKIAQVYSPTSPLPVSWLYFTGNATKEGNKLNWATVTEKDSRAFVIERSIDGINFEAAGEVKAAGNSNQELRYTFSDKNGSVLGAKTVYYRLKQLDFSGSFEYSRIIALRKDSRNSGLSSVYPNPFTNELKLEFANAPVDPQTMQVFLTSMEGKTVYAEQIKRASGAFQAKLKNLPEMKAGIYMLKIISEGQTTVQKVIKQ
jgi:uncharacterized delta-60 repeat protein